MIVPNFLAGIFARQLDVSSLISAGVSVASSLLPEITSALSVQLTVIPDSTGGLKTTIVADRPTSTPATSSRPVSTTPSISTTAAPVFTTSNTAASITSHSVSSVSSPAAVVSTGHHSSHGGLIAGVVVGVVSALLLVLLLFCCLRRRRQGKKKFTFFGKRRSSSSTISNESDFGTTAPVVHSKDIETAEKNRTNPTVPIPAVIAARRTASPADNPFDDANRSPPIHRSILDPVTEAPEGYTDHYTDGYGWGEAAGGSRRGGRFAGVGGHHRKPTPDPNSEPGRTHFGLLDYETPPPSRGIGLNSGGGNNGMTTKEPVQEDGYYAGRSWDEVDAVTKRPPPGQHF